MAKSFLKPVLDAVTGREPTKLEVVQKLIEACQKLGIEPPVAIIDVCADLLLTSHRKEVSEKEGGPELTEPARQLHNLKVDRTLRELKTRLGYEKPTIRKSPAS